jgi:putative ABC transport system permease protein
MRLPWRRKRDEADAALDEELRAHFAMAVADRIARGESPGEALASARREFGNVTHVKEVTREQWGAVWLERFAQDLRYAIRSLRRSPGFALVAIVTLALGIGVNSAMFGVMNGVLLQPLPYPSPDRLFAISYQPPPGPFTQVGGLYDAHYAALEKDPRARPIFSHVATFGTPDVTLRGVGEPKRLMAGEVTADFFAVLGERASLGRVFTAGEAADARDNTVVLSDRLWRNDFAADRNIVGKTIDLDNTKRTVIGVMPPSFDMPANADLWTPLTIHLSDQETRTRPAIARLADGVPVERATAAWSTIAASFSAFPGTRPSEFSARLVPLKTFLVGDAERPLLIFGGAVAFVLLIACANVANLLLMRVATREREMAVRAALGAGRARLIRQLLTETFTISAIGSILGIVVALTAMKLIVVIAPSAMLPRVENVRLSATVVLFTGALVLGTTMLCGLVPAMHASEDQLRGSLAEGARTMSRGRGRVRSMLVVSEIALALVLLVGAGLMLRSFDRMQRVDLGFRPANTLTMSVSLPADHYRSGSEMRRFHDRVLSELARVPGAKAVAAVNWLPFSHALIAGDFQIEGGGKPPGRWADKMVVTPDYFRAVGQRVVQGREFTGDDRAGAVRVAIVSKSVGEKLWPGGHAIGHRIAMTNTPTEKDWITIVGVVDDVIQNSVTEQPDPAVYEPMAQIDFPFFLSGMSYVVRLDGDPTPAAAAMRRIVRAADPSLPLAPVREFGDLIQSSMLTPRFQSRVLVAFSGLALVLAVVGIYGVLAYGVAQRLREIGVRVALGAQPAAVKAMVLRRTAMLALPGLIIGIAGSLALTRVLSRFLFQITPTDPPTFVGVGVLITAIAFAAAYLPAKRASEVDPIAVLRE